ncbi:hypothetical protein GGR56DRAFT_58475 [Xylariaceae sp. FL0804]|nr:hypothetical protein GGR56DRAFT_58475 [Xylariaceae sp. FL0804]
MPRGSRGKYTAGHWESKAAVRDYIEAEQPGLAQKTSYILIGAYVSNPLLPPKRDPKTGEYKSIMSCGGSTKLPLIDPTKSTGPFVRALVEDEAPRTTLLAYDHQMTINEILDAWSRVTGKTATLTSTTPRGMHEATGVPLEVLSTPAFIEEYGYTSGLDVVIEPHQLKHQVEGRTFEEWLKAQDMAGLLDSAVDI